MMEHEASRSMPDARKCPQCGVVLPAGALDGLCPACLLKQGATADTETRPETIPFQPPSVDEVARLFPQLEILGFIGKGGMGAVYKARQPALDRLVALKILPSQAASGPGFAERFNREARALARLNHPNIVAVHDFGQVDRLPFFIMEYVDGLNLRQLERAGKLAPPEALQIVPQICEALQFAHDEGIVHRDIKPENILLDKKGRVKIADFGIAKIMGGSASLTPSLSHPMGDDGARAPGEGTPPITEEGKAIGTPHYMAPEQVEKPQTVDHRADIFSLGVVFYEMLTGELPLGKFAPPSRKVQVDVRLDEIVLRALEKEPELRYQQASQVKTDVETIASGIPASDAQDSKVRQAESPRPPAGWRARVPFQAIYLCMTDAEKRQDHKLQVVVELGTLVGALALVFLDDLLPRGHRASTELFIRLVISLLLFLWITGGIEQYKDFLCSTAWARESGFAIDQIKLFCRRNAWTGIGVPGIGILIVVLLAIAIPKFVKARTPQKPRNVPQAANAVGVGLQPRLSFGPVIERIIYGYKSGRDWLLNLETGVAFSLPAGLNWDKDAGAVWKWAHQRGVHLTGLGVVSMHGLYGFEMKAALVRETNLTFEAIMPLQVAAALRRPQISHSSHNGGPWLFQVAGKDWKNLYAFETDDGKTGVLQVTGFTDKPRGLRIRYKLVQNGANPAAEPAAISEAALAEPPLLRFYAWQAEWRQDEWKKELPGRACDLIAGPSFEMFRCRPAIKRKSR